MCLTETLSSPTELELFDSVFVCSSVRFVFSELLLIRVCLSVHSFFVCLSIDFTCAGFLLPVQTVCLMASCLFLCTVKEEADSEVPDTASGEADALEVVNIKQGL